MLRSAKLVLTMLRQTDTRRYAVVLLCHHLGRYSGDLEKVAKMVPDSS